MIHSTNDVRPDLITMMTFYWSSSCIWYD